MTVSYFYLMPGLQAVKRIYVDKSLHIIMEKFDLAYDLPLSKIILYPVSASCDLLQFDQP